MSWLLKTIVGKYLKGILDKIPGNGWKTLLGILLVIIGELIKVIPEYAPILQPVFDLIGYLGPDAVTDIGIVTLITGLVHKIAKWVSDKK